MDNEIAKQLALLAQVAEKIDGSGVGWCPTSERLHASLQAIRHSLLILSEPAKTCSSESTADAQTAEEAVAAAPLPPPLPHSDSPHTIKAIVERLLLERHVPPQTSGHESGHAPSPCIHRPASSPALCFDAIELLLRTPGSPRQNELVESDAATETEVDNQKPAGDQGCAQDDSLLDRRNATSNAAAESASPGIDHLGPTSRVLTWADALRADSEHGEPLPDLAAWEVGNGLAIWQKKNETRGHSGSPRNCVTLTTWPEMGSSGSGKGMAGLRNSTLAMPSVLRQISSSFAPRAVHLPDLAWKEKEDPGGAKREGHANDNMLRTTTPSSSSSSISAWRVLSHGSLAAADQLDHLQGSPCPNDSSAWAAANATPSPAAPAWAAANATPSPAAPAPALSAADLFQNACQKAERGADVHAAFAARCSSQFRRSARALSAALALSCHVCALYWC